MPSGDPSAQKKLRPLVLGLGNDLRRDDGVGRAVIRALRAPPPIEAELVELDGESTQIVELWSSRGLVVIVDAITSGRAPGTVVRLDAKKEPIRTGRAGASTHGLSLPEAVALGQALGRMPAQLVVYGVEAADFDPGAGLSSAAAASVPEVVARVRREISEYVTRRSAHA